MSPYADASAKARYQREWMRLRRRAWLHGRCCSCCGGTQDLQLKSRGPGQIPKGFWSWSDERRARVLENCDVICRACAREAPVMQVHLCRRQQEKPEPRLAPRRSYKGKREEPLSRPATCPEHGPDRAIRLHGDWRMVCCGQIPEKVEL